MTKKKKVALITGSGRGIGAQSARLFVSEGYAVCINYHNDKKSAEALHKELTRTGGEAIVRQADISKPSEVEALFTSVDQDLGPLDVLVNNAGILKTQMRVEEMSPERINEVLTTNITGYFLCSQQAIKRMSTKHGGKGGAIVNVSSRASVAGSAGEYVDYAASKAAIDALTIGLAKEVAMENIRVNAVRPGLIYTDIHADGGEAGRVDRLKTRIPMGRGGTSAEVAQAIFWLASDKASFSTGTFIDVSGGL